MWHHGKHQQDHRYPYFEIIIIRYGRHLTQSYLFFSLLTTHLDFFLSMPLFSSSDRQYVINLALNKNIVLKTFRYGIFTKIQVLMHQRNLAWYKVRYHTVTACFVKIPYYGTVPVFVPRTQVRYLPTRANRLKNSETQSFTSGKSTLDDEQI